MRRFRITINLPALRANLSREDGRNISDDEVHKWLLDAGFKPIGSSWTVTESDLGQLDPSEVLSAEPVEEPPPD